MRYHNSEEDVVDSDAEHDAVMAALKNWNPRPVVPQPQRNTLKRETELARLHSQLDISTNHGRKNIFKVKGYGAQSLPPGDPGHPDFRAPSVPTFFQDGDNKAAHERTAHASARSSKAVGDNEMDQDADEPMLDASSGDSEDDMEFRPPGQDQPGFVPIGKPGFASKAQGNSQTAAQDLRMAIVVAEQDAGLSYPALHTKYGRWGIGLSRLRGLSFEARRPKKHRPRNIVWRAQDVSS